MNNWRQLFFLLEKAVVDGIANPQMIAKTIVFVDSINKVLSGARYLQSFLLQMNSAISNGARFNRDPNSCMSVENIVQHYHSRVSPADKEKRFNEFKEPSSQIRIIFATTSLGMGINIPDIERVVQWNWPKDKDICDLWQRLGRGGRGRGRTSIGYWFIPYWAFDSQYSQHKNKNKPKSQRKRDKQKQTLLESQPLPSSQLSQSFTPDELTDSEVDESINASQDASQDASQYAPIAGGAILDILISGDDGWNEMEKKQREKISSALRLIINGQCHRKGFMCYLGEDLLPVGAERSIILPENCCNGLGCNPTHDQAMPLAPEPSKSLKAPRKNTRADFTLTCIEKWLTERAIAEYTTPEYRFPMSPDIMMDEALRWQLARQFVKEKDKEKPDREKPITYDSLANSIVDLETWKHRDKLGASLVQYLLDQFKNIQEAIQKTNQDNLRNPTSTDPDDMADLTHLPPSEVYKRINRKKDDRLAKQVAISNAAKAEERRRELNNNPRTPLVSQSSNILSFDSTLDTDDFTSSIDISPLHHRVQSPDQSLLQSQAQFTGRSPTQSPVQGRKRVMTPVQSPTKRRQIEMPDQSPSERRPLSTLDANMTHVSRQLTWSPKSSRGRIRNKAPDFKYLYKD